MGSKSNAGSSRADKMANQVTAAQETYGKPAHLSRPVGGFTPSQLAGDITSAGGNVTFGGGQNVTRDYAQTALGQAGFNPNMIGGYGITPGDEKFSATELGNIGAMRDVLAGNIPGQQLNAKELETLSQYNRALGLNETTGMGFGDSFKQNLGGLKAQRDIAQLGNFGKGIMNLMPGRALMTGLLNKIPGVNLPTQFSTSPINYNITDQMQESDLADLLSSEQQEMYSPDLINRYLFGSEAEALPETETFTAPPETFAIPEADALAARAVTGILPRSVQNLRSVRPGILPRSIQNPRIQNLRSVRPGILPRSIQNPPRTTSTVPQYGRSFTNDFKNFYNFFRKKPTPIGLGLGLGSYLLGDKLFGSEDQTNADVLSDVENSSFLDEMNRPMFNYEGTAEDPIFNFDPFGFLNRDETFETRPRIN